MAASSSEAAAAPDNIAPTAADLLLLPSYYMPRTFKKLALLDQIKSERLVRESEILALPHRSPVFFLGLSGGGLTTLLTSFVAQTQVCYPTRWCGFMNLRKVSQLLVDHPNEVWTLPKLLLVYSEIKEESQISEINECFATAENDVKRQGELFLDGLDLVIPNKLADLIKIIKGVDWGKCGMRVWITSQTYLKLQIEVDFAEIPTTTIYYMIPFTREQQLNYFYRSFKDDVGQQARVPDFVLKKLVTDLYVNLEMIIPNFEKTLGATPFTCLTLLKAFAKVPEMFTNDPNFPGLVRCYINFKMVIKLMEFLVGAKREQFVKYCNISSSPNAPDSSQIERDSNKFDRMHLKLAIATYPDFKCTYKKAFFLKDKSFQQDLHAGGIVIEKDGKIQFIHKMYAEFILAQFFVNCGRLKNSGPPNVTFFLNKILFEEEAKQTRNFFDGYLTLQQERGILKKIIAWIRLKHFLMQHYYLHETLEDVAKYNEIKNNGSILHQLIVEGHGATVHMILCSMKGMGQAFRKLLEITVNCEIFFENPFSPNNWKPEVHNVTAFHLLALFGQGDTLKQTTGFFQTILGPVKLRQLLNDGKYTLLHYAAMSSNYEFLETIFAKGRLRSDGRTPSGKLPLNFIVTEQIFYSHKIKDLPPPRQIFTCPSLPLNSTPSSSRSRTSSRTVLTVTRQDDGNENRFRNFWNFHGFKKNFQDCYNLPLEDKNHPLRSHILTLEHLIANGGNVNGQAVEDGSTVLHDAVRKGCKTIVHYLLVHEADPNLKDKWGRTPAHHAALRGRKDILNLLLEYGANSEEKDIHGYTVNQLITNCKAKATSKSCTIS
ncbi:unnamed protein product [Orchesella dallaii]|uniref:Uncharacterized protein n=1 Tax=Orchesella dallaii TaxID=48710 RepID=A0ABP1S3R0_9HEXA